MSFPQASRVVFRAWTEADVPLAESLWGDDEVTRFFGGAMSREQVQARLAVEMARLQTFGVQYWPMFLRDSGEFAGCAGLRPWHDAANEMEAGVHVMRRLWGRRLGEEAFGAVLTYAFRTLRLEAVVAGHGQGHVNSKAMLERHGMRYTHDEPWGPKKLPCLFYRLERAEYILKSPRAGTGTARGSCG